MKTILIALTALVLTASTAQAAPPTAAQKDAFYKQCVKTSQNTTLCKCKADAAMKLVDEDFMAVIIASMGGKSLDPKYDDAYTAYIVGSTEACGMGGA
jgi:hypothetical protein